MSTVTALEYFLDRVGLLLDKQSVLQDLGAKTVDDLRFIFASLDEADLAGLGRQWQAVANRGYNDRRADMTSNIQNNLIDRSLQSQRQQFQDQGTALNSAGNANSGIMNAYKTGMNTLGEGANFGMNAGNSLQGYGQEGMDDQRRRYEEQRDFYLQQRKDYQSGMLGKAPNTSNNFSANNNSTGAGAIGGAMAGFGFAKQNFGAGQNSGSGQQQPMYNYNRFTPNPHTR